MSDTPAPAGRTQAVIAALAIAAIAAHLVWRWAAPTAESGVRPADLPLLVALALGGGYLVVGLLAKLVRGEFGSDLLAGLSIVTAVLLGEYLAGALVVLMLSGGEAWRGTPSGGRRPPWPPWPGGCRPSPTAPGAGRWRTCRWPPSPSATRWSCSRTRPARWTGR